MIKVDNIEVKFWTFPGGERGVKIIDPILFWDDQIRVTCDFRSSDDLIDLLLLKDALDNFYKGKNTVLSIPYFPYARQDRRVAGNESHSMKVIARLINSCKFDSVRVVDPHSDVVEALIDNLSIMPQEECAWGVFTCSNQAIIDVLIAPDAGAAKKIYRFADMIGKPVIVAQKEREAGTGKIIRSFIGDNELQSIQGKHAWIIDDICDGGASFLRLAESLTGTKTLNLYVTHGIFSKGKKVLLDKFDQVLCYNDMSVNKE